MDILALERAFSSVRNPALDKFIDLAKLDDEVEKFGERYRKKYIDKLEQRVGDAQGKAKEALSKGNSALDKAKGVGDELKNRFKDVQRMAKGMERWASVVSGVLGVAGLVISLASLLQSEKNQAAFDSQVDRFQIDGSKQLSLLQTQKFRIDKANAEILKNAKAIKVLEREADLASDAIKLARSWADRAYKLANDGLYESRTRIRRLNDTTAQANSNASKALQQNTALKSSVTAVNSNLKAVDTKLRNVEVKVTAAANDATQARVGVKLVDTKATQALTTAQQLPAKIPGLVAPVVNNAITPVRAQVQQVKASADNAIAKNSQQDARLSTLESRVAAIKNAPTPNAPTPNAPTVNQAVVNQAIANSGIYQRLGATEATAAAALRVANAPKPEPIGNQALALGSNNTAAINRLNQDIQALKAPNLLEPRLKAVEAAVKTPTPDPATVKRVERLEADSQQRKIMDAAANQKLDQLALLAVAIPTLAANAVNNQLSPQIQQLPGSTAAAVAAQPCNGKGCGGKTAQRVDSIGDEVTALRQQVNGLPNSVGNVVNSANLGANAAQLTMLQRIDQTTQGITGKLGSALPNGGIGGMLSRLVKSSAVDKALQVATFVGVVHNAFHLSADLGRTFFSLTSSALNATMRTMGITTADDTPIDVGAIITGQIEAQIKGMIGIENWKQLTLALASANRIYQAGSNVISNVWSMHDSTSNILEYTASNTGKIGNALKRDRVVAQDAFPDMSERVTSRSARQRKLDEIVEGISDANSALSALDSTFQEVVNINDTVVEYKRSTAELQKSIKESPIPVIADNLAVKAKREAAAAASKSPESIAEVAREAAEV